VTLGPWGRGAHGPFERVNTPYAFEKLPRLIAAVARAALR
jgi:arginine utilization protein RocB